FVNIATRREVHDGIRAPANGPNHFFNFFLNRGRDSGISNVSINLYQKIPSDDYWLELGMVDISRNNGPAPGYFVTYELRRDRLGNCGAPGSTGMLCRILSVDPLVLSNRNELHFRGNDPLPRIVYLCDVVSRLGAPRLAEMAEPQTVEPRVGESQPAITR